MYFYVNYLILHMTFNIYIYIYIDFNHQVAMVHSGQFSLIYQLCDSDIRGEVTNIVAIVGSLLMELIV